MLTITTEKQVIYINTNLLKSKLKKAVLKLLKVLVFVCGFGGFLIMWSGAGQLEADVITFSQALLRLIQGGFVMGFSYILNNLKNALQ